MESYYIRERTLSRIVIVHIFELILPVPWFLTRKSFVVPGDRSSRKAGENRRKEAAIGDDRFVWRRACDTDRTRTRE